MESDGHLAEPGRRNQHSAFPPIVTAFEYARAHTADSVRSVPRQIHARQILHILHHLISHLLRLSLFALQIIKYITLGRCRDDVNVDGFTSAQISSNGVRPDRTAPMSHSRRRTIICEHTCVGSRQSLGDRRPC